jgi:hypothetical protein
MPRQNFFKQIIIIVIISVFMAGCNTQVNVFTPTPVVAAPADTETAAPSPTTAPIEVTVRPTNTTEPIAVVTATEAPATAEAPRFTADKVGFIPKSESEIGQCVVLADPINEPEKFASDVNEVIAVAQPLIDIYTGPFLRVGGFGADGLYLSVFQDIGVVGCARFTAIGKDGEEKTGVALVIPFEQPDGTKTAILGLIDPFQTDPAPPGRPTKAARELNEILVNLANRGSIKFEMAKGETQFSFGVDPGLMSDYYSDFAKKYLATRNYSNAYLECVINKKNISEDVRALLLTMVRK